MLTTNCCCICSRQSLSDLFTCGLQESLDNIQAFVSCKPLMKVLISEAKDYQKPLWGLSLSWQIKQYGRFQEELWASQTEQGQTFKLGWSKSHRSVSSSQISIWPVEIQVWCEFACICLVKNYCSFRCIQSSRVCISEVLPTCYRSEHHSAWN